MVCWLGQGDYFYRCNGVIFKVELSYSRALPIIVRTIHVMRRTFCVAGFANPMQIVWKFQNPYRETILPSGVFSLPVRFLA